MTATDIQDYVPENEWPSVATMLDGFGDQTLPASAALTGTALHLPQDGAGVPVQDDGDIFSVAAFALDEVDDENAWARFDRLVPGCTLVPLAVG